MLAIFTMMGFAAPFYAAAVLCVLLHIHTLYISLRPLCPCTAYFSILKHTHTPAPSPFSHPRPHSNRNPPRVITVHILLIVRAKFDLPALIGAKKDGCLAITADVLGPFFGSIADVRVYMGVWAFVCVCMGGLSWRKREACLQKAIDRSID